MLNEPIKQLTDTGIQLHFSVDGDVKLKVKLSKAKFAKSKTGFKVPSSLVIKTAEAQCAKCVREKKGLKLMSEDECQRQLTRSQD